MSISRRQSIQGLAIFAGIPMTSLRAQAQISAATAINRSARLRALSQRSTKLYAQLILNVLSTNARGTLVSVQKLIQTSVDDLAKAALNGAMSGQYAIVTQNANNFVASLQDTPSKDNLVKINSNSNRLLSEADKLTSMLEANTKQSSAKLINMAGRQRMLSQRLAKNYFLAAAGLETTTTRSQIGDDRNEFKQALVSLQSAPVSTPAIRNELQLAQTQWTFFEAAINRQYDEESMKVIATTSERLLEVNNNLTNLYETALRDLLGNT
jgi:Type IV pili methyl-accepting chemotaxis transducer N-term